MNKLLYIVGIVFGAIFLFTCGYFILQVEMERSLELAGSYLSSYSDSSLPNAFEGRAEETTSFAATISVFFFLLFIIIDMMGVLKIKTKTNRIIGIIGLSFSGVMFLWNFLVLADPGAISFDEVGPVYVLYSMAVMAFSIVGLVQSIRFANKPTVNNMKPNDLLDS